MKQENADITYIVVLHYSLYTTKLFYSFNDSYIKYANFITSNGLDPSTTCNYSFNTYYKYHGLSAKYMIPTHKITPTVSEANI